MLGYSAIPNGKVIKIVPNMESGEQATAVVSGKSSVKGEEVVVRVIPLENVSATQLIPVLDHCCRNGVIFLLIRLAMF